MAAKPKPLAEAALKKEIGRRVAAARRNRSVSAQLLAQELGISREAVTHIENGRNNITAVCLWKIATLLHTDVGSLLPVVPDGYALTPKDTKLVTLEAGEQAAQWAQELFANKKKATS